MPQGLLLNWGFVVASLTPWLQSAAPPGSSGPGSTSPYVVLLARLLIFGLGFSLLYLFVAQKYATRAGFRYLYSKNREYLHAVLSAWLDRNSPRLATAEAALTLAREAPARMEPIADPLPPLLREMVRRAVRKSSVGEMLASINAGAGAESATGRSLKSLLLTQIDRQLQNQFGTISPWWLRSLLIGNTLAMLAAFFWLR
jgi:hypothetical protein